MTREDLEYEIARLARRVEEVEMDAERIEALAQAVGLIHKRLVALSTSLLPGATMDDLDEIDRLARLASG